MCIRDRICPFTLYFVPAPALIFSTSQVVLTLNGTPEEAADPLEAELSEGLPPVKLSGIKTWFADGLETARSTCLLYTSRCV